MPVKGLSQAEIDAATAAVVAAGGKSTDRNNRLPGETATEANARITAAYKAQPKPELTKEGAAAGATIKWVRTAAGGVGEYKEVFPVGAPIPTQRTTAYGNTYDAQGNLVSGTGLKPGTSSTATKTPDQQVAYDNAKALAEQFVSLYGGTLADYFDATTGKVKQPSAEVINKKLSGAGGKKEVSRVDNGDGTFTVTYDDKSVEIVGTKRTVSSVVPGSTGDTTTGGPTLAINTFKNTLALFFGATEMTKPWVDGLYKSVSGFYKTGSTIDEAFNLALMESKGNPNMTEFTKRFKGIYDLTDLKAKGAVVTVPTIAQYFATETTMGQVLTTAGLGSLANEEFLGNIIGKNVSVTEFTNRISKVYDRIDSAPAELKSTFARFFPSLDRVTLAKALLTGEKGAADLAKEVASYEIVSASSQQGLGAIDPVTGKPLGIGLEEAENIAAQGYGYQAALTGFKDISQNLQPYEKLMEITSGQDVSTEDARKQLQDITFGKLASAQRKADQLAAQEESRFKGASGLARGGLTSQRYGLV